MLRFPVCFFGGSNDSIVFVYSASRAYCVLGFGDLVLFARVAWLQRHVVMHDNPLIKLIVDKDFFL